MCFSVSLALPSVGRWGEETDDFQTTLKENMNFGIELCRLVYPR